MSTKLTHKEYDLFINDIIATKFPLSIFVTDSYAETKFAKGASFSPNEKNDHDAIKKLRNELIYEKRTSEKDFLLKYKDSVDKLRSDRLTELEKNQIWNKPEALDVDYDHYSKMEYWTLDECIFLLFDKNPEFLSHKKLINIIAPNSPFLKKYVQTHELAKRAIASEKLLQTNYPSFFINWAKSIGSDMPEDLVKLVEKRKGQYIDYKSLYERAKNVIADQSEVIQKLSDQISKSKNEDYSTTSTAKLLAQERRELILKGYLTGKGLDNNQQLKISQEKLWDSLNKIDNNIFPPTSDDTIKAFFRKQKLCSFTPGRK